MNQRKNVLMIGGPADGRMYNLDARRRIFVAPESGETANYAIGTLIGLTRSYNIGLRDTGIDAILALLAGYRRPRADDSDANEAARNVTVLGGPGDGMRVMLDADMESVTLPLRRSEDPDSPEYRVVPLVGKDQRKYRVALREPFRECPIGLLIEGYRKPLFEDEGEEKEECRFCGCTVESPCDAPPPDTCEKALTAAYGNRQGGMK